jgi:hypothetical protein
MAGYDFSGSGSNAATLASRSGEGAFNVGGGLKLPPWLAPALILVLAVGAFLWIKNK